MADIDFHLNSGEIEDFLNNASDLRDCLKNEAEHVFEEIAPAMRKTELKQEKVYGKAPKKRDGEKVLPPQEENAHDRMTFRTGIENPGTAHILYRTLGEAVKKVGRKSKHH